MVSFRPSLALAAQLLLVPVGIGAAVLAPPAQGAMLAVPLGRWTPAEVIEIARRHGGAIEGVGPLGTLVVSGRRDRLAAPFRARAFLLIGWSRAGCRI